MRLLKKIIIIFIFLLYGCKSSPIQEEAGSYSEDSKDGFYPIQDKRNLEFLSFIEKLESDLTSFSGDFSMQIKSGENLTKTNNLDGKIFFDKATKRIKIELLIPILGWKISQVVSDGEKILIQSANEPKLHQQPMGDIVILDPNTNKKLSIPFPVIYHSLTLSFLEGFQGSNTKINPTERKVKVIRGKDEYLYVFYEKGLDSLEFKSIEKNLQAKCKIPPSAQTGIHPPSKMLTKVSEISSGQDFSTVEIQYKNMKKLSAIPNSVFQF